ncbi:TPA: hypothetical protein DEX28_03050, partial [Patescibacteria group bacterium]|nr:hypothetical protein [Patescibacteria group bacterium]
MRQEFFSRTGILVFSVTILGILAFLFFGALIFVTLTAERSLSVVSGNALRDHISVASEHINRNVERYSLIANSLSTNQEIIHLVDNPLESNKAAGWVLIETKINFGFEEIFLFLDNGRVLFQNARDTSPYANEDFRPLVQKAVEFKTPSIFFFDSIIYQSPVLYVAVPVYGEGRSGVLVIGKVFNEKQLRNLAPAASQGILLFSKNNQKITANFYSSFFNQAITLKDYKEIFENAEQGEGFFKSFNQAEFSGIVGVVPVRFNSIPLGLMGFYVETKTQQQIQKNIAITASGALILLLVVFITAARFLHRLVVVPIGAIRDGFKRLAEGLFETSIPPQGLREVHEIGIGFNEMAVKLKEVYTDLEQKIKDRTKKLSETVGDLEGKNEEMERSKQAMLNLLEDEREAEEKIKQQSEDLRKAFADVQKFASVADQERNM